MTAARTSIEKSQAVEIFLSGAPSWIRTNDRSLKRRLLYQLSYGRVMKLMTISYWLTA